MQELLGVNADIVCFGKAGGGLPVGAFASSNDIMSVLAPEVQFIRPELLVEIH